MSNHTPGPWEMTKRYSEIPITGERHLCGVYIGHWPLPVCEIYDSNGLGGSNGGDAHVQIANAILISAAPDLLEALETLLDAVNGNHITEGDCNQAKAALAKAKGEA